MTVPYIEYVASRLDGRRLCHCVGTARLAAELARRNGVAPSAATVAGLIHDVARPFSDDELLAYLDEMLPVEKMATVENELRNSETLRKRTSGLVRLRDRGIHSVGAIWRQQSASNMVLIRDFTCLAVIRFYWHTTDLN